MSFQIEKAHYCDFTKKKRWGRENIPQDSRGEKSRTHPKDQKFKQLWIFQHKYQKIKDIRATDIFNLIPTQSINEMGGQNKDISMGSKNYLASTLFQKLLKDVIYKIQAVNQERKGKQKTRDSIQKRDKRNPQNEVMETAGQLNQAEKAISSKRSMLEGSRRNISKKDKIKST